MRTYDPTQPLIFIHVPKTAGKSVEKVFQHWFGNNLHRHYFNAATGQLPPHLNLDAPEFATNPPVIYGHFNRRRGFGVEEYYPQIRQFVSNLRDPLDLHVSTYFFILQSPNHRLHGALSGISLETFIQTHRPNMLEHFPRPVSADNYRDIIEEFFIDIGCQETLEASLQRIGRKLAKPVNDLQVPRLNTAPRGGADWQQHRAWFRDHWPVEHAVYDYVRAMAP